MQDYISTCDVQPLRCLPNYQITNYTVCIETLQVWKRKGGTVNASEEVRVGVGRVAAGIVAVVNSMNN